MAPSLSKPSFDVLVIGAGTLFPTLLSPIPALTNTTPSGLAGLISAQRYLDAHPTSNVALLEKEASVGGVFSKRRLYPGFYTQWTIGMSEFGDAPMKPPPEEDRIGDCYKAKYTMEYLENYAETKMHAGRSLKERIAFGMDVKSVEKVGGEWHVTCTDADEETALFKAERIMVAAGEYSKPNIPAFRQSNFDAPIIHHADFGCSDILSAPNITHVTVLGAGKSSADMLYVAVKAGKKVTWIIRVSGAGPGFFAPIDLPTPYQNGLEAAQTRIMGALQPNMLHKNGWWVWFLHQTWIGIAIVTWIFGLIDKEAKKRANYRGRPHVKNFEKLEYDPGYVMSV